MRRTYVRYIMNMVIFMSDKFSYQTITCKSALNKIDSFLPYHYDLNIYRGCEHHCVYCFARRADVPFIESGDCSRGNHCMFFTGKYRGLYTGRQRAFLYDSVCACGGIGDFIGLSCGEKRCGVGGFFNPPLSHEFPDNRNQCFR